MTVAEKDAGTSASASAPARIWEEDLVLPTYLVGAPGRNADIFTSGWQRIYPYTLCDDLLYRRQEVTYRAVYLENEYLQVIVLPQLGGHIYSAYDKLAGQEMFHRNHVIKPSRIRLRGNWCAYGIEFNFPRGHSVTSAAPVDYRLLTGADGSVAVAVGDCEQMSRMRWTVIIGLRPNVRRVEVAVRLTNRTELPHRYYYWANASVSANEHVQFLSPARAARRFGEDLPFPYEDGLDKRWYKNHFHGTDLFTVDCPYDFFGYYDHGRDFGVVHVADRHILPGKKFFTWGCGEDGLAWATLLSDNDGPYIEIQAGSHDTQADLGLFDPHASLTWQECWYPVWKLGAFDFAAEKVALRLEAVTVGEEPRALVRLQVTEPVTGARLRLVVDGHEVAAWPVDLLPSLPTERSVALPSQWDALVVEVSDGAAGLLARHQMRSQAPAEGTRVAHPRAEGPVAEAYYRRAIASLKQGNEDAALEHFGEALARDPHFSPALRDRGMVWLGRGLADRARKDLEAALVRNPEDDLARYYLALAWRDSGAGEQALEEALTVAATPVWGWLGWQLAGELHLASGRFAEAEGAFRRVLARQPALPHTQALLSAALRYGGRAAEAQGLAQAALEADPLEHLAMAELWLLQADEGLFQKTLRGEAQSYLEVASDYLRAGLFRDAQLVLECYLSQLGAEQHPYPLVHYYLGYVAERLGQPASAREHYRHGATLPFDYVFPHRLESEAALRAALAENPADARAYYYLGNLLASRSRYDEALPCWEQAVKLEPTIAPAQRNVGLALWHLRRDGKKALAAYRKAIASAPGDHDLYVEADDILEALGLSRARVRLLAGAPHEVLARDKVAKRLAAAYYAQGRYDRVLEVLRRFEFWPWEGERTAGVLYSSALTGKALLAMTRKQYRQALRYFEESMKHPPNFHMGRPAYPRFAKQKYLMAQCLTLLKEEEKARQLLQSAADERYVGWDRDFSEALYYNGLAKLRLGRRGEARRIFSRLRGLVEPTRRRWLSASDILFLQALGHRGLAELGGPKLHLTSAKRLLEQALKERADFPAAKAMREEVKRLLARKK
jgi:tetratricopeptide (TPR) repeat protein